MHTMKMWSTSYQVGRINDSKQSCDWSPFLFPIPKLLWHDRQRHNFNRTVQFWNECPQAVSVPTNQNTDAQRQCNKTWGHQQSWNKGFYEDTFPFQVQSSAPKVSSYNKIICEFTYSVTMPAKTIGAAAREIAPVLLTVVKWVSAVSIQVRLQIMVCLGSETKYISNKLHS
jgi:hypothetical protein